VARTLAHKHLGAPTAPTHGASLSMRWEFPGVPGAIEWHSTHSAATRRPVRLWFGSFDADQRHSGSYLDHSVHPDSRFIWPRACRYRGSVPLNYPREAVSSRPPGSTRRRARGLNSGSHAVLWGVNQVAAALDPGGLDDQPRLARPRGPVSVHRERDVLWSLSSEDFPLVAGERASGFPVGVSRHRGRRPRPLHLRRHVRRRVRCASRPHRWVRVALSDPYNATAKRSSGEVLVVDRELSLGNDRRDCYSP
jgi:hypothetical protein